MSSDEDLILLAKFVLIRFHGTTPPDEMLANAVADWRKEAF